jgi:hypothetical protein
MRHARLLVLAGMALALIVPGAASAASSAGCEGGGFVLRNLADASAVGTTPGGTVSTTIAASRLGTSFLADGKYVEFGVVAASLGVTDWTLTGAPNALDITGGRRTVVYAAKTPNHRGLVLTSPLTVSLDGENLEISRTGPGLTMKVTAKDCANGGVFQMEVQRADETKTVYTHTLGAGVFYFDNPIFRAREGDVLPYKDTTVTVGTRINFGNDLSAKFVGRDSPQVATRINNSACLNPFVSRVSGPQTVQHCGGVSQWDVSSGGRMGQVMGEDATEVSPPATVCTHKCQAQNQVKGRATILGFPFPVPDASRLKPRFA